MGSLCAVLQFMYQNGWDDLIYSNNVDLTVAGHFHVYSRTCPVVNQTCIPTNKPNGKLGGPIHVTTGWGGPQSYSSLPANRSSYIAATNNMSTPNGFLRVTVSPASLFVEALSVSWTRGDRAS